MLGGGGGAGNNWASGFYEHGAEASALAVERVRREAERADCLGGLLLVHSVAGGTGSGAGCAAARALRDAFPGAPLLSCAVWPFEAGEVAVQAYNALLTLDVVGEAADGIVLQRNEALARLAVQRYGIKRPELADLNALAAQALAAVLAPGAATREPVAARDCGVAPQLSLAEICEHLCCLPQYKLLTPAVAPHVPEAARDFEQLRWPAVLKELRRAMEARGGGLGFDGGSIGRGSGTAARALASAVVLHGQGADTADASEVCAPELFSCWAPAGARALVAAAPLRPPPSGLAMSAAALSNSSAATAPVAGAVERAYSMYAARAYVHQYEAHGGSAADIEAGLASAEETLASYAALHAAVP